MTSAAGTAPGSTFELPACTVADAPKASLPVNDFKISAPAALNMLWPEVNSGKGGVTNVTGWDGSQSAPSMTRVPRYGPAHARPFLPADRKCTAVTGRTESEARFHSQATMPASEPAVPSPNNSVTAPSTVW